MANEGWIVLGTLGGALIGSVIAPFFNHLYRIKQLDEEHKKKIDYMKKEKIFEKKLEYLENILKILERRSWFYSEILYTLAREKPEDLLDGLGKWNKEQAKKIEEIKEIPILNPCTFLSKNIIPGKVVEIIELETKIAQETNFLLIKLKDKKFKEEKLNKIKEMISLLNKKGDDITKEIKEELKI
ncbi:hypothetical protein M0R19_00340 [Candidatus Pacearchaeota archaeon]|nr:hypothetical protein [Candidatus Pacearchaeota archaeon]